MNKARSLAKVKGGICLSSEDDYVNSSSKLVWKCEDPEHSPWTTTFHAVFYQKTWCPKCKYQEHSRKMVINKGYGDGLERAKNFAKNKAGQCLSLEYKNDKAPMVWKCQNENHEPWTAAFNTLTSQGLWCKKCNTEERRKQRLLTAKNHAKKKRGFCLSNEYVDTDFPLEWKCSNPKHNSWFATLRNLLSQDQWCPECAGAKHKTENRVRMFLETSLGFPLKSSREDWNINPKTGRRLELDGYNEEHKIAFEHNGEHHYKTTLYSPSISDNVFILQLEKDEVKRMNCKNKDVKLIVVPILKQKFRYKFFHLLRHVIKTCKEQSLELNYSFSEIKTMRSKFYEM